ncbi:uncharacterized protein LOC133342296 [Lethenteron reissneri]|uniref:uncharacterized protein LOC133342296 n=1 Tax=Lethenteron reissneri TaxID=7753 RepID=UPI002AB693E6|nr:uncharacterized protein LOC133342296 [Lethenteron reissneri]
MAIEEEDEEEEEGWLATPRRTMLTCRCVDTGWSDGETLIASRPPIRPQVMSATASANQRSGSSDTSSSRPCQHRAKTVPRRHPAPECPLPSHGATLLTRRGGSLPCQGFHLYSDKPAAAWLGISVSRGNRDAAVVHELVENTLPNTPHPTLAGSCATHALLIEGRRPTVPTRPTAVGLSGGTSAALGDRRSERPPAVPRRIVGPPGAAAAVAATRSASTTAVTATRRTSSPASDSQAVVSPSLVGGEREKRLQQAAAERAERNLITWTKLVCAALLHFFHSNHLEWFSCESRRWSLASSPPPPNTSQTHSVVT